MLLRQAPPVTTIRRATRGVRHRGVTLIELVVSIVVVSIAVTGVLLVMNQTIRHSADPMAEHQAVAIAESYLEEILSRSFDEMEASGSPEDAPDPGPDSGETDRTNYDDVNDYHNLANNGCLATSLPCPALGDCPCDQTGAPIDGLNGYSVKLDVAYNPDLGPAGQKVGSADAALITVRVTHPAGVDISISGYRTRY